MKKIMTVFLFMCLSLASVGQSTEWVPPSSADYLKKSRQQKTTGFVVAAVGSTIFIVSLLTTISQVDNTGVYYLRDFADDVNSVAVGVLIASAGTLCIIASVPLFIASARNKRKATSISGAFQMERLPAVVTGRPMPALCLRLQW